MKFPFNQVFMKQQQSFLFVILTFKTICLSIQDLSILEDANNLLIHHVKRQTSIHKEDKHKIKVLLKHFLMDRFKHARQDLSDDEREDEHHHADEREGAGIEHVLNELVHHRILTCRGAYAPGCSTMSDTRRDCRAPTGDCCATRSRA